MRRNGIYNIVRLLAVTGTLSARAATYYVDDVGGNDASNGQSSSAAWRTLAKVSATVFQPGDLILFRAGGAWTGELQLNGNGSAASPVVVDQYGTGNKPLLNGAGHESAVRLQGISDWEVNNLEIINDGGATLTGATNYRAGVLVKSVTSAVCRHIYLRHLEIHNVFPERGAEGHGIHVIAAGSAAVNTYYDDVRIEDCQISLTGHYGVWVQHTGSAQSNPGYQYNQNILVQNNTFTNTGGSAAETGYCDGVRLENNTVDHSGASVDPRQWARGSGYWPWQCKNVIVQSNQFLHARGPADSCGCHIDYGCSNVVVQYNLSLDNAGGFVEILGGCANATYRYNVSINDGWRVKGVNGASQDGHLIWVSDYYGGSVTHGSTNSMVCNNTIYVGPGVTNDFLFVQKSVNTFLQNNLFYLAGRTTYADLSSSTYFNNNLWYGSLPSGVPFGPGAVLANPQLAQAGGTNASDYLISGTSPAIGAGLALADHGGQDFWGNPLPPNAPCIGANQRDFVDPGVVSVNFISSASQQFGAGFACGIPGQNSVATNWLNLNQTFSASQLPFESGLASSISLAGSSPGGWNTGNSNYAGTPLLGGPVNYTNAANPTTFTLQGLRGSFPLGYKIIVYLGGYIANTGGAVSDGATAYYYQPLAAPVAPVPLMQTLVTNDPGSGHNPPAQYAVFGWPILLTNDSLTISLKALSGAGLLLGGFQIRTAGEYSPRGVPAGWFRAFGLPVDDDADADGDGVPAWREFFAGTDPTNAQSSFRVIGMSHAGNAVAISWLGGINGWQGNWSMAVSTNLVDWAMLESQSIPRAVGGTNTWMHALPTNSAFTLFYRPCVEYMP